MAKEGDITFGIPVKLIANNAFFSSRKPTKNRGEPRNKRSPPQTISLIKTKF